MKSDEKEDPQSGVEGSIPEQLISLRNKIDEVDRGILELIATRRNYSNLVGETKKSLGLSALRDPVREHDILTRLSREGLSKKIPPRLTQTIFSALISESLSSQEENLLRTAPNRGDPINEEVGYIARDGIWGEQAALTYLVLRDGVSKLGVSSPVRWSSLNEAFGSFNEDVSKILLLPIDHSTLGTIRDSLIAILESGLSVIREVHIPISISLMTPKGVELNQIRRIFGSELTFRLCSSLLETLGSVAQEINPFILDEDEVKLRKGTDWAILGPEHIGITAGLKVVATSVSDTLTSSLRFFACSLKEEPASTKLSYATCLVAATGQTSGSLSSILDLFRSFNIVLTKLESLGPNFNNLYKSHSRRSEKIRSIQIEPIPFQVEHNSEFFLIECLGCSVDESLQALLTELNKKRSLVEIVGSYPRSNLPPQPSLSKGMSPKDIE